MFVHGDAAILDPRRVRCRDFLECQARALDQDVVHRDFGALCFCSGVHAFAEVQQLVDIAIDIEREVRDITEAFRQTLGRNLGDIVGLDDLIAFRRDAECLERLVMINDGCRSGRSGRLRCTGGS